jgi:2-methylcitrate dehydratase
LTKRSVAKGPTILERIGDYVAAFSLDSIDPQGVETIRRLWLDSLGCCYGGSDAEPSAIVRDTVAELGGATQATILCTGTRTAAPYAALANGVATRYWDFMDVYFGPAWTAHPSDNVATILAVAEAYDCSGRAFLEALVVAYEVQLAFSDLPVPRNLWHLGWHHTAACAYASAAAVGKLLGLSGMQIADAMALSGARANTFSEIRHGDIPMDKALSAPLVASNSILPCLLARRGFTGCRTLLEGPYGFRYAVAGGVDVEALVPRPDQPRLGKVSIKPYPVEGMTIAMVQAALDLRRLHQVQPGEIRRTRIYVHEEALKKPSWDNQKLAPTNKETADHSFPYCVAAAFVAGRVTQQEFTARWLADPTITALMAQTEFAIDPALTQLYRNGGRPARVEIETDRGTFAQETLYPRGDPRNPMSDTELIAKFTGQAEPVLGKRAGPLAERILRIDNEISMRGFVTALVEG